MPRAREHADAVPGTAARGIRLIVLYKAVKATAEVALLAALVALSSSGELEHARELAARLDAGVASRWGVAAAAALRELLSVRVLHVIELGLLLDAAMSAAEGWVLWRGYRWGPLLVLVTTACPLPLEIVEIARSPHAWRVALAAVNLLIVLYLARRWRAAAAAG